MPSNIDKKRNIGSSNHLFIIKTKKRNKVRLGLLKNKIFTTLHYYPIHLQPYYRRMGFQEGDFPESEAYANNAISLPIYPGLEELDQQRIVEALAEQFA